MEVEAREAAQKAAEKAAEAQGLGEGGVEVGLGFFGVKGFTWKPVGLSNYF